MPVPIRETQFVKRIFIELHIAEIHAAVCHRSAVFREILLDERQSGRIEFPIMQSDVELTVADDSVLVRPDIANLELGKTERLVEFQRLQNIRRADGKLQEPANRGHREAPIASARWLEAGSSA